MAQYVQRVDESVYVARPVLVPGRRGLACRIGAYPDYLAEHPLGPMREVNNGMPLTYLPQRVKTFAPTHNIQSYSSNVRGTGSTKPYMFKSRQIAEISTRNCI